MAGSGAAARTDDRDERQEQVNALVGAGWREQWSSRRGARPSLWVRQVGDEYLVYAGTNERLSGTNPMYRVDGERVFRLDGHPDGPSSIPFLQRRAHGVYRGESHPGGRGWCTCLPSPAVDPQACRGQHPSLPSGRRVHTEQRSASGLSERMATTPSRRSRARGPGREGSMESSRTFRVWAGDLDARSGVPFPASLGGRRSPTRYERRPRFRLPTGRHAQTRNVHGLSPRPIPATIPTYPLPDWHRVMGTFVALATDAARFGWWASHGRADSEVGHPPCGPALLSVSGRSIQPLDVDGSCARWRAIPGEPSQIRPRPVAGLFAQSLDQLVRVIVSHDSLQLA